MRSRERHEKSEGRKDMEDRVDPRADKLIK